MLKGENNNKRIENQERLQKSEHLCKFNIRIKGSVIFNFDHKGNYLTSTFQRSAKFVEFVLKLGVFSMQQALLFAAIF